MSKLVKGYVGVCREEQRLSGVGRVPREDVVSDADKETPDTSQMCNRPL